MIVDDETKDLSCSVLLSLVCCWLLHLSYYVLLYGCGRMELESPHLSVRMENKVEMARTSF